MDFETFGGGCGLTALLGVFFNSLRIGQWQGKFENRVSNLEQLLAKQDLSISKMNDSMNQVNQTLAEIKTKLEYFIERQENNSDRGAAVVILVVGFLLYRSHSENQYNIDRAVDSILNEDSAFTYANPKGNWYK